MGNTDFKPIFKPLTQGAAISEKLIATYDLEWFPDTFKLRVFGIKTHDEFKVFKNIKDSLNYMLSPDKNNMIYWAHYGGKADINFFLQYLINSTYIIEGFFSGSSIVILRIKRGRYSWTIADSFPLFHNKLSDVLKVFCPEFVKKEKGWNTLNEKELIEYLYIDCTGLREAILKSQIMWRELGGELCFTAPSCATKLFQCKYQKNTIYPNPLINEITREAYHASRVEVWNSVNDDKFIEGWDIKSSFPYSMKTVPMPGNYIGLSKKIPEYQPSFVRAKIRVTGKIGVVPYKIKGRIFFPVGEWTGLFSNLILNQKDVEILKVYEVYKFEPLFEYEEFVDTLFKIKEKGGPLGYTAKIAINGSYGKRAQSPNIRKIINYEIEKEDEDSFNIYPGIGKIINEWSPANCEWVPVAATVTANSMVLLNEGLRFAISQSNKLNIFGVDTDGFFCECLNKGFVESGDIGTWERKAKLIDYYYGPAPKLYEYHDILNKIEYDKNKKILEKNFNGEELEEKLKKYKYNHIKAKGLHGLKYGEINNFWNGIAHKTIRMNRVSEQIRSGDIIKPSQKEYLKFKSLKYIPKRNNGECWELEELKNKFGIKKE